LQWLHREVNLMKQDLSLARLLFLCGQIILCQRHQLSSSSSYPAIFSSSFVTRPVM
jgi:hypothetical protein